jgi:7-carboxy-7-deazaguanine synthase
VQGEADAVGWPTVFVRLTGCPLRCVWCDTEYAFHGGKWRAIADVIAEVGAYTTRHVCVTGGEPLAQKRCLALLAQLCDLGYEVSLETSGAIDVGAVDSRVRKVVDLKAPGSGECARNLWSNLAHIGARDQIKIVIADRRDYEWARERVAEHALADRCQVLFSPVYTKLAPRELAEWILADRLPVRFQMQLHKALWGETPGK